MKPEDQQVDLEELYQEIILDHAKDPRNARKLEESEVLVDEENPTCGDQILLTAKVEDGKITAIEYEAHGCAISTASASMMSEMLVGKTVEEAKAAIQDFVSAMKGEKPLEGDWEDVHALEGVKKYPLRIKCATMSWHAASHAIDKLVSFPP